ncbi:MAG: hypothetical protein AAF391_07370, partial [Bacteroidota bacterium]
MQEGLGRKLVFVIAMIFVFHTKGQEITVRGGFVEDSLLIGQNINYWLTASYPASLEMVFPDSNYTFSPFEYADKTYFPTQFREGLAFDSTVYTLQSFEIDPVQYFKLITVVLDGSDSTIIDSPQDSIFLTELAPMVSDTTALKENLAYQDVNTQFNYPLFYYIIGGVLLLVIILLLIFGKKIIKFFKLRKLERDYKTFSEAFNAYVRKLKDTPEPDIAEKALSIWKMYQQRLDKVAFTTLTTKEILTLEFA